MDLIKRGNNMLAFSSETPLQTVLFVAVLETT